MKTLRPNNELKDEQDDIDFNAVSDFEDFLAHPEAPSGFDAARNLEYILPENISFQFVTSEIDQYIQKNVKRNKDFTITLICGKDTVLLEYPAVH